MQYKEDGWLIQSSSFLARRGRKPVSVFKSAIYLRNLPPGIGRAALICQYIWSCRPCLRTRPASLTAVVGSYPAFSPLPIRRHQNEVTDTWLAVVFCYGRNEITPICAFRSRVPCPVRTFLTVSGAADRPALSFSIRLLGRLCPAKVRKK